MHENRRFLTRGLDIRATSMHLGVAAGVICFVGSAIPAAAALNAAGRAWVRQGLNEFNYEMHTHGMSGVEQAISNCYRKQSLRPNPNAIMPCLALDESAFDIIPIMSAHFHQQVPLFFTRSLFEARYRGALYRVGFPNPVNEDAIMRGIQVELQKDMAQSLAQHQRP